MSVASQGYSRVARTLHWLSAVLVLAQFGVAILMPDIGPKAVPGTLVNLHLALGVLILMVTVLRVVNRAVDPVPLDERASPPWERLAARSAHMAFYVLLLAGPLLGWASASAHRLPVSLFGLVTLPALAAPRTRWALKAGDLHTVLMWVLLGLVALHAAVALYHHFVRKDEVLRRMWPARRR
jgi:cytochrome b561